MPDMAAKLPVRAPEVPQMAAGFWAVRGDRTALATWEAAVDLFELYNFIRVIKVIIVITYFYGLVGLFFATANATLTVTIRRRRHLLRGRIVE